MKVYINRLMIVAACSVALAACSDNSWNEGLDGFEEYTPVDRQTIEYTLTANDYKTLAANSTNKALAGEDGAKALAAVGTQCYFTDAIPADVYVPALLNDPKFPYFALSNGSAIKLTYNVAEALPAEVAAIASAPTYKVTEADYQQVWGSEENYTNAFAPSHTAAKSLPALLAAAYPDAEDGDFVIANYNTASVDPVFNQQPEEPEFKLSNVLGSLTLNSTIDAQAYVAAVSTQGPVITDAAGSVFAYLPSNNNDLKVGDQIKINATVSSYNYGFQLARGSSPEVVGTQAVTYPAPKTWTGAEIDKFVADAIAEGATPIAPIYSKFTGTVTVSGNYINIILDGTNVQVSPYGANADVKALLPDGATVTFEGYVMALASKGKYLNTVITKVGSETISTLAVPASRAGVSVASTNENAVYKFNGSAWTLAPATIALSHADYQAMGQSYDNLSGEVPASYLPIFLQQKLPYAAKDDTEFVVYSYYNGSATVVRCDQYRYTGSEWVINNGVTTVTSQFVRTNGKWNYDPSVTITLPAGRGIAISTLYFQTCVDWIRDNVTNGPAYVTSYGNNEYYCGTSAYQGNVDLRPSAARTQYAGYDSMTDDEIVALEKKRFETEVFPAALSILHPDAAPVPGIDVTFTINFFYYTGTTQAATIIYHVTAPATFEFVSCTWNN